MSASGFAAGRTHGPPGEGSLWVTLGLIGGGSAGFAVGTLAGHTAIGVTAGATVGLIAALGMQAHSAAAEGDAGAGAAVLASTTAAATTPVGVDGNTASVALNPALAGLADLVSS